MRGRNRRPQGAARQGIMRPASKDPNSQTGSSLRGCWTANHVCGIHGCHLGNPAHKGSRVKIVQGNDGCDRHHGRWLGCLPVRQGIEFVAAGCGLAIVVVAVVATIRTADVFPQAFGKAQIRGTPCGREREPDAEKEPKGAQSLHDDIPRMGSSERQGACSGAVWRWPEFLSTL